MSFPPGIRLPAGMSRPLYATSPMPSGAMMVQMAPVRPVAMVPVSQVVVRPVMRPIISQSQAAFVRTMQPQTLTQVMTNQAVLQGQQVWIQTAEPPKSAIISKPPEIKKDLVDTSSKSQNAETINEPAITVFVGNITDRASDTLVRQLLMKCGSVYSWKRVQGPSGKLQAFGFCEYKDPESALRAIHILHEYTLGDKKLLVKVDAKTQELIDNWKKEKGMNDDKNDSSSKLPGVKEALSEIEGLVQGYSGELAVAKSTSTVKPDVLQILKPDPTVRDSTNIEENLEELQLEEDKKNFISKEIRSFRESQKQQEERLRQYKAEREKARSREILLRERGRISRSSRDYYRRTRSPRSRSPRSRSYRSRTPRSRTPRSRTPRSRTPRSRTPRSRTPRSRTPRSRTPRSRTPRSRTSRSRSSRSRTPRSRSSRSRSSRSRSSRSRSSRSRSRRSRTPRRRRSRSVSPYRKSPRRRSRTPSRPLIRRVSPRRTPPRRRSRSPPPRRRSTSGSVSWSHEDDSDWEEKRRRLDRKIKEKEASYQQRLNNFEMREKRQKRIYEKRAEQEASERDEMVKEAKKLREFLADYDDDKQDELFYSGVVLKKKLQDRDVEIKEDEEDKKKEAEELRLLKERLVQENHPDPDGLLIKPALRDYWHQEEAGDKSNIVAQADEIWKPLLEDGSPRSTPSSSDREVSRSPSYSGTSEYESNRSRSCSESVSADSDDQSVEYETEIVTADSSNHKETTNHRPKSSSKSLRTNSRYSSSADSSASNTFASPLRNNEKSRVTLKLKRGHSTSSSSQLKTKHRKLTVSDVFNQDDEEDVLPKKKKFAPMHLSSNNKKVSKRQGKTPAVDKKKRIRALIDRIPTEKDDLFQFNVDWSVVDSVLMEKRIKPWITKKIVEYIGENEPTLVEFISSKVFINPAVLTLRVENFFNIKIMCKSSPSKILEDISMVLDEEADVFVAKLWRLVIYETEARKEGLTKL